MYGPYAVCCACAPGTPIAADTCRALPFTKMARWAWMWNRVCSPAWQLICSTGCPFAAVASPASGATAGTATPSGPVAPGAGAGWRAPSVLSGARRSPDGTPPAAPELPVTARTMAAATTITVAAAAPLASRIRRRRRRACSARIRAILSLAACLFLLRLAIGSCLSLGLGSSGDQPLGAEDAVAEPGGIGQVEPAGGHSRAELCVQPGGRQCGPPDQGVLPGRRQGPQRGGEPRLGEMRHEPAQPGPGVGEGAGGRRGDHGVQQLEDQA